MTRIATENMALPASVEATLRRLIWRARAAIVLRGALATAAAGLAGVLIAIGIRTFFLPTENWQHYGLTLLWLALAGATAFVALVRPMARSFSMRGMARTIEERHPELHERLSTTVELLSSGDSPEIRGSHELIQAVAQQASGDAGLVQPRREVTFRPVRPFMLAFGGTVAILIALLAVFPGPTRRALTKTVMPWANVASVFADELTVRPGDTALLAGGNLHVDLGVQNAKVRNAELRIARPGEPDKIIPMAALGEGRFQADTDRLFETVRYRLRAGDAMSQYYTAAVVIPPKVESVQVSLEYPAYTGLGKVGPAPAGGDIKAPVGTKATVQVTLNKPVANCQLTVLGQPVALHEETAATYSFTWQLVAGQSGKWHLAMTDEHGFAGDSGEHELSAVADRAPRVEILRPVEKSLKLRPTDRLPVAYRLDDDFGFTKAELLVKIDDKPQPPQEVPHIQTEPQDTPPQPGQVAASAYLNLAALRLAGARSVKFCVRAYDNLPPEMGGPHTGDSEERTITLDAAAADYAMQTQLAAELRIRETLEKVYKELTEAKKTSTPLRESMVSTTTVTAATSEQIDGMLRHLATAEDATRAIAAIVGEGEFPDMGKTLSKLADEHIGRARQCGQLAKISDQQKARADNAEEADVQIIRALDIVSDLLKKLDVLTDLARKAVELQELAAKEELLAKANVTTQPSTQPAAMDQPPQMRPEDWKKAQAELAAKAAELARKTAGAPQAEAKELSKQSQDLLAQADKLQKEQQILAENSADLQKLQAIKQELAKAAAEQAEIARQADALAKQAAATPTATAPAASAAKQTADAAKALASTQPFSATPAQQQALADLEKTARQAAEQSAKEAAAQLAQQAAKLAATEEDLSKKAAAAADAAKAAEQAAKSAADDAQQQKKLTDAQTAQNNDLAKKQADLAAAAQQLETAAKADAKPSPEMTKSAAALQQSQADQAKAAAQQASKQSQALKDELARKSTAADQAAKAAQDNAAKAAKDAQAAKAASDQAAKDAQAAAAKAAKPDATEADKKAAADAAAKAQTAAEQAAKAAADQAAKDQSAKESQTASADAKKNAAAADDLAKKQDDLSGQIAKAAEKSADVAKAAQTAKQSTEKQTAAAQAAQKANQELAQSAAAHAQTAAQLPQLKALAEQAGKEAAAAVAKNDPTANAQKATQDLAQNKPAGAADAAKAAAEQLKEIAKAAGKDDAQPPAGQPPAKPSARTPEQLAADQQRDKALADAAGKLAQQQKALKDKTDALLKQQAAEQARQENRQLARLAAEQKEIEKDLAQLADAVKQKAPTAERLESKAILDARKTSDQLAESKPAEAAKSASQAAGEMKQLSKQLDDQAADSAAKPQQPAQQAEESEPEQLAKMADQAGELAQRQQRLAQQAGDLAAHKLPQLLGDRQDALADKTDETKKQVNLIGEHVDGITPDATAKQLAQAAEQALAQAQAAEKAAAKALGQDQQPQAAPQQQASAAALAQASGNLRQLGQRLADMAKQLPAPTPENAEQAEDMAQAAEAAQNAAKTGDESEAAKAARMLSELAQHAADAAEAAGVKPENAQAMAAAMQASDPKNSPKGPSQGRARVGSATVDLSPAELKALGIAPDDWARFKGELKNQVLQSDKQLGPEEYRTLIKRYFQAVAAKNAAAGK